MRILPAVAMSSPPTCRDWSPRALRGRPTPVTMSFLPEVISKEPFGPAVRHGDDHWHDLVKWSLFAMIEAEELGLTSKNIEQQVKTPIRSVQRFVGATGDFGKMLSLDNRWAYNIIKQVGNYGESFERHLDAAGPRPRPQQAMEQRRPPVRAAIALKRAATNVCKSTIASGPVIFGSSASAPSSDSLSRPVGRAGLPCRLVFHW